MNTVLLPTGTLEPHGVINNGADNTAPTWQNYHPARWPMVRATLP